MLGQDNRILDEPAPVMLLVELGESSVDIAVRPWVKSFDYSQVRSDLLEHIKRALENERARPLLEMLGVRASATGPDGLLERLIALSTMKEAPVYEVVKWYHRLDQIFDRCSSAERQRIKDAFEQRRLVLTGDGSWTSRDGVCMGDDGGEAPGAAVVSTSLSTLSLWPTMGSQLRPTAGRTRGRRYQSQPVWIVLHRRHDRRIKRRDAFTPQSDRKCISVHDRVATQPGQHISDHGTTVSCRRVERRSGWHLVG